jgi:hypothetical protein
VRQVGHLPGLYEDTRRSETYKMWKENLYNYRMSVTSGVGIFYFKFVADFVVVPSRTELEAYAVQISVV